MFNKFVFVCLLVLFSENVFAGYAESDFSSLTAYRGGVVNIWQPGDQSRYYATWDNPSTHRFKVYIPPGAYGGFDFYGQVGQGDRLETFFIARAGQPPDTTRPPDNTVFSDDGFSLSQLNQDCYGTNSAGYLLIAKDYISPVMTTGTWIYVDIYHIEGGLGYMHGVVEVNQPAYALWYNSALFGSDGDPSASGAPPSPRPTPAPTPISTPVPTPTSGPGCDPFTCSNAGGRCVNNTCVYPSPTPTAKPTPKPTPVLSEGCNVLFCTLSGGKCVGNICVPNSPTPTPAPIVDVYQGVASGVPTRVELTHETDLTGSASITVGEQTAGIAYRIWEHDGIKTVYVSDVGYLEIVGNTMKIDVFSGITLDKK
jgi:hypothetical protein